jgi:hypothetical protein
MTLADILRSLDVDESVISQIKCQDYTLVVHEPGEKADEVVNFAVVFEVKSIYLEHN